jgi:5-methylcytosine-specific restriction endonuclease McrA
MTDGEDAPPAQQPLAEWQIFGRDRRLMATDAAPRRDMRVLRRCIVERDGARCHWCMRMTGQKHGLEQSLDHLIPRSDGGSDDLSNMVISCLPCNNARGSTPVAAWTVRVDHLARQGEPRFAARRRHLERESDA